MLKIDGYTIQEKLYEGMNSTIYKAIRNVDKLPVAIKVLSKEFPSNEDIARFNLEYKICSDLNIDDIPKMYSIEKYQDTFMIVMEYIDAKPLSSIISSNKITIDTFLKIAIKIVDILGKIHNKNIIHKDINPSNILWNPDLNQVKIIDFGISALLSSEIQEAVNPKGIEGTLVYISPEQTGRMNRKIDYRSDYYSLGITLYELLTGQKPFKSEDMLELVHCHIAKVPMCPYEINQDIPKVISDIILKLMSKNAEDRYQSSFGIKHDFEEYLRSIDFKIGEKDIPERFEISQKLYGREKEIEKLMNDFYSVAKGEESLLTLVAGYSGIGKSTLVSELYKPILEKKGYLISGKFDQLSRNIPYMPFIQAFNELISHILTESDGIIDLWKKRILEAVGSIGQVIVDIIPKLETIIGKQLSVPELPPEQAINRFTTIFQKFVKVLASKEHPLVIFIDDLQWADLPSFKMLELLLNDSGIKNILFIGAYRENEVAMTHPLIITLNEIKKYKENIHTLLLGPLNFGNINNLISDTLWCDNKKSESLTRLCESKTNGNPFFLNQFLKSLYDDRLLEFDNQNGEWKWDILRIEQKSITDNVVDLMVDKIQKLSSKAQDILKLAACIGNTFDISTLSVINEKSEFETSKELFEALQADLIIPLGNKYKLIEETTQNSTVSYKFSHDRVQQAAYYLIDEDSKKQAHLKIGRLL